MDNLEVIFEMLQKYLGGVAGLFTSAAVIWKVFGPKIKEWIRSIAEEIIEKPLAAFEKRFTRDLDEIRKELITINEYNNETQSDDTMILGYTILKDCKEFDKGDEISEMRYSQLCAMYARYTNKGGNGVVEKAWNQFLENVKVV